MISCCTASRANHLRSAGTMNHGASSVSVRSIAIRYASVYWSQYARSSRSPSLNFQCFVGSSRRANRRSACSSGEIRSITLTIRVPAARTAASNSRIAPYRSSTSASGESPRTRCTSTSS